MDRVVGMMLVGWTKQQADELVRERGVNCTKGLKLKIPRFPTRFMFAK